MSCGAPATELLTEVDVTGQTIIEGVVVHGDEPVTGAYVRLLDRTGEFTAEVPTTAGGQFRFFAVPGEWTVRALAPRVSAVDAAVRAEAGRVTDVKLVV
jgi:hypothetical protein